MVRWLRGLIRGALLIALFFVATFAKSFALYCKNFLKGKWLSAEILPVDLSENLCFTFSYFTLKLFVIFHFTF